MPRRIEIELTSTRPDGSWTWRAAGAKEPRGIVEGTLVHEGAKAGDVMKAEAEFEIDGITITSIMRPKEDNRREPERIEVVGPARRETPGVTTQLVGRRRDSGDRRQRGERPDRDARRPGRERAGGKDAGKPARSGSSARAGGDQRPDRTGRPERGRDRRNEETTGAGRPAPRDPGERTARRDRRDGGSGRSVRPGPGRPSGREASGGEEDKGHRARRLNPGHVHRQAILESLSPEERPVAEQVLRGGIPAVRTALHLEREKAAAEGRPAPNTDQLIAMAEQLLPRLKAAEWRDRAEAAAKDPEGISLRDLRSVVAGADVARDEETRSLAVTLREALERRISSLHSQWADEIVKHLDDNRVVRALRLSARPPEPSARLETSVGQRLSEAAGQALSSDTAPDRWLALLDAAAASPVRRSIQPAGLPTDPSDDVKQAAVQQSGRIPALAAMLGVAIPPPPTPTAKRPAGKPAGGHRPKPGPGRRSAPATGSLDSPESPASPASPDAPDSPATPAAPAAPAAPASADAPDSPESH